MIQDTHSVTYSMSVQGGWECVLVVDCREYGDIVLFI